MCSLSVPRTKFRQRPPHECCDAQLTVGETVILLTPPVYPIPIETPATGAGGCHQMAVSPTANAQWPPDVGERPLERLRRWLSNAERVPPPRAQSATTQN